MTEYFEISHFRGIEDCLEKIFSYCTMGEILACRQVSKSWKRVIDALPYAWNKALTHMIETNKFFFGGGRWFHWKEVYDHLLEQRNKNKIIKFSELVLDSLKKEERHNEWLDPICSAIIDGKFEVVEMMLSLLTRLNNLKIYSWNHGGTGFVLACKHKRGQMIQLLAERIYLTKTFNIFQCYDDDGRNGLFWLCYNGMLKEAEFCFSISRRSFDLEYGDISDGTTPLMIATIRGHISIVEFLIGNGANLNDKDKTGKTPFIYACWQEKVEIVNLYLNLVGNKRIDVNAADAFGRTAFIWACMFKLDKVVELIQSRAEQLSINLQKEDKDGLNGEDFLSLRRSSSEFEVMENPQLPSKQWNRKYYVGRYCPIRWKNGPVRCDFCKLHHSTKHAMMQCEYRFYNKD